MLNIEIKFVAGNSTFTQVKSFPESVTPKDVSEWLETSKPHFEQVTRNVLTDHIVEDDDKSGRLTTNVNVALNQSDDDQVVVSQPTGIDQVLGEISETDAVSTESSEVASETNSEVEEPVEDSTESEVIVESTAIESETDLTDVPVDMDDLASNDDLLSSSFD